MKTKLVLPNRVCPTINCNFFLLSVKVRLPIEDNLAFLSKKVLTFIFCAFSLGP